MMRLAVDENFNGDVVRGLLARLPDLDLVRVQDAGLMQTLDPLVLAWAAANDRVLLTHDRQTIPRFAHERTRSGLPVAGVIAVKALMSVGWAVEELVTLLVCVSAEEMRDQVVFIPL